MLARPVQPPQQIAQMCVEGHIALVPAEAAGVEQIAKRAAAGGARNAVAGGGDERPCRPPAFHDSPEEIAQRCLQDRAAGLHALLLGALLAQMERDLGVVLDLGQVDDGFAFLAVIAQHQGIASTELTVVSRPSSRSRTRSARPASWRLWVTPTTPVSYPPPRRKNISCSRSAFAC